MDNKYVKCPMCLRDIHVEDFRDRLSIREYSISGLCQICQDFAFDYDEDEESQGESWYDEFDLDGGDGLCNCDPADCECGDNWFPDEKDYLVEEILDSPKDEKDLEDDDNHK